MGVLKTVRLNGLMSALPPPAAATAGKVAYARRVASPCQPSVSETCGSKVAANCKLESVDVGFEIMRAAMGPKRFGCASTSSAEKIIEDGVVKAVSHPSTVS